MALLVESVNYGYINTTDITNNVFYVIMFTSGAYTLQENTTIDCWFQYQLLSTCIQQRYCAFTTNSPAVITFTSIVVFSYSLHAPDMNMIT